VHLVLDKVAHKEAQEVLEVHNKAVLEVHMVAHNKEVHKEVNLEEVVLEALEVHNKAVLEVHMEVHKEVNLEEEVHKEVLEVHMEAHKEVHLEEVVLVALEVLEAHMEVHKEVHMEVLEVRKEVHKVPMEVHKEVLKVAHMDLILPLVVEARHKEEEDIKFFLIFYLIPYYVLMETVVNIVIC